VVLCLSLLALHRAFIEALGIQQFSVLRKHLYCAYNTLIVANELSSTLIPDLHAVKEKQTVKYTPLKEREMEVKSPLALLPTDRHRPSCNFVFTHWFLI